MFGGRTHLYHNMQHARSDLLQIPCITAVAYMLPGDSPVLWLAVSTASRTRLVSTQHEIH